MTLAQLRYIVAVDTYRHFGEAAESCHVSQPTLSMGIQKVEEEIGAAIFDRSRKPVTPTDLGGRLVEQARTILRERARIDDIIAEVHGEIAGELSIGIIPTLAPYLLPMVTRTFAERYPKVILSIHELTTAHILQALAGDRLDAGLIATQEHQPGMTARPLFVEHFVAFISPDHRLAGNPIISATDLNLEDIWLLSEGHCFRQQILDLCGEADHSCGPRRTILFESGNLETLRHMVERGGGMTLLPYTATHYLSAEQTRTFVRPFTPPAPYREVSVIYGRALLKKRLIDAYVEVILAAVPKELRRSEEPVFD